MLQYFAEFVLKMKSINTCHFGQIQGFLVKWCSLLEIKFLHGKIPAYFQKTPKILITLANSPILSYSKLLFESLRFLAFIEYLLVPCWLDQHSVPGKMLYEVEECTVLHMSIP